MKRLIGFVAGALVASAALVSLQGVSTGTLEYFNPLPVVNIVTSHPGGEVYETMDAYHTMRINYQYLQIEGVCASACTFFLGLMDPEYVCASEHAIFGFHGVYSGQDGEYNPIMSKWVYSYVYPEEIRNKLENAGWEIDQDVNLELFPTGMVWLDRDDLGVNHC